MSLDIASEQVTLLLAAKKLPKPDMSLSDFLKFRYEEAHSWKNYFLPLAVFHVVYLFGMYWSFVELGFLISRGQGEVWKAYSVSTLSIASIPAAGFVGAGLLVLNHLFWRTVKNDLTPRAFLHLTSRLLAAPIVAFALGKIFSIGIGSQPTILFIAFGIGLFPSSAFQLLEKKWLDLVSVKGPSGSELPLRNIQGIGRDDELRLWEEGIMDAEQLAVENVVDLLVNTNYSLERIIDWKDQAFLYVYVKDDIEKLRNVAVRGSMDVLGLEPKYYKRERSEAMRSALARVLQWDEAVIDRFVDTIYNDPRVHQLWGFLTHTYPTKPAEPIVSSGD
jgi:hypothetical protein